jgi:GT2 family glycosyltransferase
VVVPTYGRADRLSPLLRSLAGQTLAPHRFEVVVVDDCSPDGSVAAIGDLAGGLPYPVRVLSTPSNRGPAAARNLGWLATDAPLLAFLDDDCTPAPGWLEAGLAALGDQPEAGVIQGRTLAPDGVDVQGLTDWYVWRIVERPEPEFMACNIFYRRSAFDVTGGFDEEIGWWGEDTAAGWRVLEAGWERGFAPDATVTHPVERRGWAFFVRNGLAERNMVRLGVEHPGYRAEMYWRPWAYRKEDAAFVAAAIGAVVGLRFRPALLLALPYLWWRRPSVRRLNFLRLCLQVPVVDAARVAGHLRGSVECRVLVV